MLRRAMIWLVPIAAILLAIAFINRPTCCFDGNERYTRPAIAGFIMGLKTYQSEYNRLPLEALTSSDQRAWQQTCGSILDVLYPRDGDRSTSNPRGINFYDPPMAKDKRKGLYYDDQNSPILVDPWGEPYYFIIAFGDDGKVPNPDSRDNKSQPFLDATIIMFSAGPDRDPNTWDDNVLSWK